MHADAIIYHNYFKSPNLALHQTRHIHVRAGRCDRACVPAQAPPAAGAPRAGTGQGGHGAGGAWGRVRAEQGGNGEQGLILQGRRPMAWAHGGPKCLCYAYSTGSIQTVLCRQKPCPCLPGLSWLSSATFSPEQSCPCPLACDTAEEEV